MFHVKHLLFCCIEKSLYLCRRKSIKIEQVMSNKSVEPQKVKKWIAVIIAILSAIAGALGESATNVTASLLGL